MQSIITPTFAPQTTPAVPSITPNTPPAPQNAPSSSPTAPSSIDPAIVALMHGIKTNEGANGNYTATGDNGTAAGIAMWSNENAQGVPQPLTSGGIPANFQGMAKQYGLDPTDFSAANQNQVLYASLAADKKAGLSPEQILSKWNSGDPNAYLTNPVEKSGVSATGTQNVAAYVKNGMSAAQAYAAAQKANASWSSYTNPDGTPATPAAGSSGPGALQTIGTDLQQGNLGSAAVDTAKSLFNFAFPIVGDLVNDVQGKDDKSALQQLGDAGMSALWFLPFGDIAEGLGLGAEALGIGAKAAGAAGTIGTGLAAGYAGDVSSNLSSGKTGAAAFTPGLGTLTGGALSVAGLGAASLYNKFVGEQNVVDKVTQAYSDAAGATKTMARDVSGTAAKGLEPNAQFLANAGIPPETAEVNGKRIFTTGAASASQQTLSDRISALSDLRDAATAKSGMTVNPEDLRQSMLDAAQKQFSGTDLTAAQNHIDNEMDAIKIDPKYSLDENGNLNSEQSTQLKTYLQGKSGYDATRPSNISQTYKTMAGVTKTAVEDAATKAGTPEIAALNKIIQQHYDAQDFLTKLDGQTVKGGRLGKYVSEGIGAAVGSGVGGAVGGPLGGAAGAAAGGYAGAKVSDFMQHLAAGGPLSAGVLGRMASEDPEIVQKFAQYIGNSEEGAAKIAPVVQPVQKSASEIVTGALKKLPARLAVPTAFRSTE